ncbi:MAG: CopD family protein [Granulosicoccaceae bacterium]
MAIALALHVVATVVWVGGMFFAYVILRPSAAQVLNASDRLILWVEVLAGFFRWVTLSILMLLGTGYWMLFGGFGGFAGAGVYIHVMHGLGLLMIVVFAHVFSAPYRRMASMIDQENWSAGAGELAKVRRLVGLNLALGLTTIVTATAGKLW